MGGDNRASPVRIRIAKIGDCISFEFDGFPLHSELSVPWLLIFDLGKPFRTLVPQDSCHFIVWWIEIVIESHERLGRSGTASRFMSQDAWAVHFELFAAFSVECGNSLHLHDLLLLQYQLALRHGWIMSINSRYLTITTTPWILLYHHDWGKFPTWRDMHRWLLSGENGCFWFWSLARLLLEGWGDGSANHLVFRGRLRGLIVELAELFILHVLKHDGQVFRAWNDGLFLLRGVLAALTWPAYSAWGCPGVTCRGEDCSYVVGQDLTCEIFLAIVETMLISLAVLVKVLLVWRQNLPLDWHLVFS